MLQQRAQAGRRFTQQPTLEREQRLRRNAEAAASYGAVNRYGTKATVVKQIYQLGIGVFVQMEACGDLIETARNVMRSGESVGCNADINAARSQRTAQIYKLLTRIVR